MPLTTYKNIKIGDRFGASNDMVGTVQGLTWIDKLVQQEVEIKTQYGYETHPVSDTVLILHEASNKARN
jgi:hypothetical protein